MPVVKEFGPALPVGNSAGRGFHPRPERSTPAKYLLGFSLSTFRYRCSKSSSRLYRSSTAPVGDCIPDRNDPPPPNPCSPISLELSPSAFPILMFYQVWGVTPHPNAGRGLNPRPERSTPAKYPPTLPNSSPPPLPNPSHFPRPSNALAWVDRSGRGYNPRPAQSRNAPPSAGCGGLNPRPSQGPERSPFAGCGMLIIKYRLGASVRICFCRSATEPVGGFIPDRNDPPPPNICLSSQTPGTLPPAKYPSTLPNSSPPPLPNPSHFPRLSNALAWVDRSGRGYNPRPAQGRNAPPLLVAEC